MNAGSIVASNSGEDGIVTVAIFAPVASLGGASLMIDFDPSESAFLDLLEAPEEPTADEVNRVNERRVLMMRPVVLPGSCRDCPSEFFPCARDAVGTCCCECHVKPVRPR